MSGVTSSNVIFEASLSYYNEEWRRYERKWMKLSDNKVLIIMHKNKKHGKIMKTIDLIINDDKKYGKFTHH